MTRVCGACADTFRPDATACSRCGRCERCGRLVVGKPTQARMCPAVLLFSLLLLDAAIRRGVRRLRRLVP